MEYPKRKRARLKEHDYSKNGAYFVTICTKDRRHLLWDVGATYGRPHSDPPLSNIGHLVNNEIKRISAIYDSVSIEKSIVMPNHVHMIILIIQNDSGRPQNVPTVSRVVQQFKGSVSKQAGFSIWQKSFYEHIIRNEQDYIEIWNYIDTNPLKWLKDKYYNIP